MKPSIILFAALGLMVGCAAPSIGAEPAEKDNAPALDQSLNRLGAHYRELNALVNPPRLDREDSVEPARPNPGTSTAPTRRDANLQTGTGLQQGTLQPAPGLQGTSRGLTPESEWRRIFPKKPNGSPRWMAGKDDLSGEIQKLKAASEESFRKLSEIQGRIEALQKRLAQRAESTSSHPGNKPRRAS